jgi:hypothetical protein
LTRAASALLASSQNYRVELELHPCDAVPSLVHVRIVSWFSDAKRPDEPQIRYRTTATRDALIRVRDAIDAALIGLDGGGDQGIKQEGVACS